MIRLAAVTATAFAAVLTATIPATAGSVAPPPTSGTVYDGSCRAAVAQTSIWPWSPHYVYGHSYMTAVTNGRGVLKGWSTGGDVPKGYADVTIRHTVTLRTASGATAKVWHVGNHAQAVGRWYLRRGDRLVVATTFGRGMASDVHCTTTRTIN